DHDRDLWMLAAQPPADLDATDVGQTRVEQDHIGPRALHEVCHLPSMAGLADHLEVRLRSEHRHKALSDHLVVVHDKDSDSRVRHQVRAGIWTRIASPLSSPLRTSNVPPRSSTWRRLRFIPKWVPLSYSAAGSDQKRPPRHPG